MEELIINSYKRGKSIHEITMLVHYREKKKNDKLKISDSRSFVESTILNYYLNDLKEKSFI